MENTVKCNLTSDKDLICFLAVLKKCLPHQSWCTVLNAVIKEKREKRNYYHGVNISYNLFNYIFHMSVAWLPCKQSQNSQTPNVND